MKSTLKKNRSVSQSIAQAWTNYEKQVRSSRSKASIKNIHKLRVSTQKFEAILNLANCVHQNNRSKNIISQVKNIRKSLGPLRDMHIQFKKLQKFKIKNFSDKKQNAFLKFMSGQKKAAHKKAIQRLDDISLRDEKNDVKKIIKKIKNYESENNKKSNQIQLNSKMKIDMSFLNDSLRNINPERAKEIHEFRTLAKKIRYQAEYINSITDSKKYDLKKIKFIQNITGEIQNDSVLIHTLDHFLKIKKNYNNSKVLKIKKEIQDHQAAIVKKDLNHLTALK